MFTFDVWIAECRDLRDSSLFSSSASLLSKLSVVFLFLFFWYQLHLVSAAADKWSVLSFSEVVVSGSSERDSVAEGLGISMAKRQRISTSVMCQYEIYLYGLWHLLVSECLLGPGRV